MASTSAISSNGCPTCATLKKSGKSSCCGPGGAWFKNCGNAGDSKFAHTWNEGIEACKETQSTVPTKTIPSTTCPMCGTNAKTGTRSCCIRGGAWFKKCGSPGGPKFEHTWVEGVQACKSAPISATSTSAISSNGCPMCATLKKSGKRSCCGPGGAWFKNCGNPGDSKFGHTWFEGIEACKETKSTVSTKTIPSTTCPMCGTNAKSGKRSCCIRGGAWFKKCGSTGDTKFEHTWVDGVQACKSPISATSTSAISSNRCLMCASLKKSGKSSCCGPGGVWYKNCGNPGDSKFGHTWFEGIEACKAPATTAT